MSVVAGKQLHLRRARCSIGKLTIIFSPGSDDNVFEEDEVTEFYDPEVAEGDEDQDQLENGEDQDNVIISGDPSAAANASRGDKSVKDKKIPDEDRNTTPYMTKYERARILGTRALQIRYAAEAQQRDCSQQQS